MDRYVCPPWYRCRCHPGKPVSESTMLRHMRAANMVRKSLGRGLFKRGPKIVDETTNVFDFGCNDSLEEHPSDVEGPSPRFLLPDRDQECLTHRLEQRSTDSSHLERGVSLGALLNDGHTEDANLDADLNEEPMDDDNLDGGSPEEQENDLDTDNPDLNREGPRVIAGRRGLSDEERGRGGSRIPGFMCWLHENHGWVELFYKHGLSHAAMDDILQLISAPCRTWKTVISNISDATSVVTEEYAVCPGHKCFATPVGEAEITNCSICDNPRPPPELRHPSETVSYIPLIPRLTEMIADARLSEQLYSYRRDRHEPSGYVLQDYFDSSSFTNLCNLYGGKENLEHDVFIATSTDGFQAFKNNSSDVWPLVSVLFNLPPHLRFIAKNVLPLMFIPNDVQPKDLQSYLIPFVNELLSTLQDGGIEAFLPDGRRIRFRIHLIWFSSDLAGLVKIAGITGHVGRFPCRLCLVEGFYSPLFQHYYYPTWLQQSDGDSSLQMYDPRNLSPRTIESTEQTLQRLEAAPNVTAKKQIATETGIKQRSILLKLPTMRPFSCFPPDVMHLFYNVQVELLHHHMSGMDDGFALRQRDVDFLDEELVAFAAGTSGQIAVKPRRLKCYTSWKAAEHKVFTISYYLILFDGYLSQQYLDGMEHFVRVVDICFRPSIRREEALEVKRLAVRFVEHFENCYSRHDPARVNYCKYVIHLLLHLGDSLLEYGPLICASQYWVEKYIGWICNRSNARYLPAKSMLQSACFGEAKRLFFKEAFHENESTYEQLVSLGGYKFMGPRCDIGLNDTEEELRLRDLIASYLVRKHPGLNPCVAKTVSRNVSNVTFWSRLQFLCGSDSQTARCERTVNEPATNRDLVRPSCYVSVEMDVTDNSADVYYGKIVHFMGFEINNIAANISYSCVAIGKYDLAMIQWVNGLLKGRQGQVFKVGSRESVFRATTLEDVTIIRRLIAVVEHSVPAGSSGAANTVRKRKQTYFIDDFQRIDHLLSQGRTSEDGRNRRLRGMARG